MYKYLPQLNTPNGFVDSNAVMLIDANMTIPFDPANTDYQAYLEWVAKGNTPEPADE
jgi:hypothetical protein